MSGNHANETSEILDALSKPGAISKAIDVYDTTLRDGLQQEGLSLTVEDKLRVAEQLDILGVKYIEGGWPGANPKDSEFFRRAANGGLHLKTATLTAFGMTRRPNGKASDDKVLRELLDAQTPAICMVAKSWDYHVTNALQTDLDEGVAMVRDSVRFLIGEGRKVFLDAEHFFDGFKRNPDFALRVLNAAEEEGAEALVLCDTNGGCLPYEVEEIVQMVRARTSAQLGAHFHNDSGCAVANTLTAVRGGITQVQGCVNGYGERTGNADLSSLVPNLQLKMGMQALPEGRIERITAVSHHLAEIMNVALPSQRPYVGTSAFTHKAGLHTSAIVRARDAYEHLDPTLVGNGTRFVVSEMAGRSTLELKAAEMGLEVEAKSMGAALDRLKQLEYEGYHFEVADGSLELLLREASGWRQSFFRLESYRVINDQQGDDSAKTEATIKVWLPGENDGEEVRVIATGEGNGPVNALDSAFRKAVGDRYPHLASVHLTDYKVRVLDSSSGTGARTRVLIDSSNGDRDWTTIGVSENVIEASWRALSDAIVIGLLHGPVAAAE